MARFTIVASSWGVIVSSLVLVACKAASDPSPSQQLPAPAEESSQIMTQERCETDTGFVFVPGGAFIAGRDRPERDYAYQISAQAAAKTPDQVPAAEQALRARRWFDREPDRQTQTIPGFCMARNLVTNAEYQIFVQATGHRPPGISAAAYQQQGFLVHPYAAVKPYLWESDRPPTGRAKHPVVLVSYTDALAYAAWRSQEDQYTYRLPTALEWEKAARGEDGQYFPWGDQWQSDATNWSGHGPFNTSEVATYPLSQSSHGIEDMAGNVFEYTSTLQSPASGQPASQADVRSVMKGCSWDDLPGFCRAAYRHTRPIESRHILFGYRLVRQ